MRRCVQTAIAALRRLPAPETTSQPVPFLLHPQLQEIYLGPADTGRSAAEIFAEFPSEAGMTDQDVLAGHVSYPSWLDLDLSALISDPQWYRQKELLPPHLSVTKPHGRNLFARRQADAILDFLHSAGSWQDDADLSPDPARGRSNGEGVVAWRERSVLVVGHAGALGALLPRLPARLGKKHSLGNGQVVNYLLEVSDRQCRFEPIT